MKTGKTIQPLLNAATPWSAWALRLMARHRRWADAPRATLLLHARLSRMQSQLMQRFLSFHADFHTLVNATIDCRGTHSLAQLPAGARQMQFNPVRNLLRSPGAQTAQLVQQADTPARRLEFRRAALPAMMALQRAVMLASIGPAPEQQRTQISRPQMRLRNDADQTPVARLLARRLRHPSDESSKRIAMALRREAVSPATSRLPSAGMPADRRLFEQQVHRIGDATAAPPAVNVEQLASQVLKHIDRRVIARRERMGQV